MLRKQCLKCSSPILAVFHTCVQVLELGSVGELRSQTRNWDLGYTSVANSGVIVEQKGADKLVHYP